MKSIRSVIKHGGKVWGAFQNRMLHIYLFFQQIFRKCRGGKNGAVHLAGLSSESLQYYDNFCRMSMLLRKKFGLQRKSAQELMDIHMVKILRNIYTLFWHTYIIPRHFNPTYRSPLVGLGYKGATYLIPYSTCWRL